MNEIQKILEKAHGADQPVAAELLPLLYDELRSLATEYLSREMPGQTLQPTALVHEAWLRIAQEDARMWNDRTHFFRAAAQAMRRILVDRARAKASQKRGEKAEKLDIDELDLAAATMDERVLLVDELLDRLEQENPESSRIVTLKFFGGLTEKEIGAMDGTPERTIRRRWAFAKARLVEMLHEGET